MYDHPFLHVLSCKHFEAQPKASILSNLNIVLLSLYCFTLNFSLHPVIFLNIFGAKRNFILFYLICEWSPCNSNVLEGESRPNSVLKANVILTLKYFQFCSYLKFNEKWLILDFCFRWCQLYMQSWTYFPKVWRYEFFKRYVWIPFL